MTAPILVKAVYQKPYPMHTDGSPQGLSAVLGKEQEETGRVIAYASRSLQPTQCNPAIYDFFKDELFAVIGPVTKTFAKILAQGKSGQFYRPQ